VGAVTSRTTLLAVAGIALALVLAGCRPEPAVEPTPTFSSETEAFAAAEATYREYVKALNAVDLSDPETFDPAYTWTAGEANAGLRELFSQMHADGWVVAGESVVVLVAPLDITDLEGDVALAACLDVSGVTVVDDAGQSVVEADRRDVQSLTVTMVLSKSSPTKLLVSSISGREGEPSCDA
jgi:ABC-type transport system substrate-binding protein